MSIKTDGKKLIFQSKYELMVIEPYGENIIRVRSTINKVLNDEAYTLLPPATDRAVCVKIDENNAFIENGMLKVEANVQNEICVLTFYRFGKKILKSIEDTPKHTKGAIQEKYRHRGGNNYTVKLKFEACEKEHIFGLGQEQGNCFDKKNTSYDLYQCNTKTSIPVIYSSLGYGFFWNNPSIGRCEFNKKQSVWIADSTPQADYLVFTGNDPKEVMYNYGMLTGFAPMMPEWVCGFWQSKLRYESQKDILQVAREYKERNLPLDAIVIDYFHWTEFGDWDFDCKYWPNPAEMCKELEAMNVYPVISVWPAINKKSKNFQRMSDDGMLVSAKDGRECLLDFIEKQTYIDPTNPKTRSFQWEQIEKSYYSYGIKAYWLDATEPEINPLQFDNLIYYIGDGEQVSLAYPYFNQKTFYDGLAKHGEQHSVLLTRSAYAGSQKFGAIVWNGDIPSTFEALHDSIISGLSMGMCGIPWWNSDIGGFSGGDIESEYFRELILRWFQFGLFCPIMRLHGVRKRQSNYVSRNPGIIEESGGDNEIWSFGEENYPVLKEILLLRERLKPYIAQLAQVAADKGTPIMRPMFFEFPNDECCYELDDQYMFGSDILFAPIYKYGETARMVYLPEGEWIRTSDKSLYRGNQNIVCTAAKNEFIAFVKKNAAVLNAF